MTGSSLKIIAMVTMVIDHVGFLFFPGVPLLRIIGRVSFPIFAFAAAEGARFTHDRKKYLSRLLLWGFISEVPFDLMGSNTMFSLSSQNVCFTLAAGVACIYLLEQRSPRNMAAICAILAACTLLVTDYSFVGVLSVVIIHHYIARGSGVKGVFFACLLLTLSFSMQIFALLALIPIALYNGKRGVNLKYLFYAFYPLHMLILWAVWVFTTTVAT